MEETNTKKLLCEETWVYLILMLVGGFYGGYTYCVRGGVFCNAQTANFVLISMAIGRAKWGQAVYYLIPMTAYLMGSVVSEALPKKVRRLHVRWDTLQVLIELAAVIFIGFLPRSVPVQIAQVTINFICSMRYNTYRQMNTFAVSTIFCTNHVRQEGIALVHLIHHPEKKKWAQKLETHVSMLGMFMVGACAGTFFSDRMDVRAIWVLIPFLLYLSARLLYADLVTEKDLLDQKPMGH